MKYQRILAGVCTFILVFFLCFCSIAEDGVAVPTRAHSGVAQVESPPMEELERAAWYGFIPAEVHDEEPDSAITWRQYCALIQNMIDRANPSLSVQWETMAKLASKSDEKMLRDQGCFVLYRAMELMGLQNIDYDYLSVIPNPHLIEYGDFSYEYRPFTGDGNDGWIFDDVDTVDFGTRRYIETAVMACHQRLSFGSFELLYDPDISVEEILTVRDAVCSVIRLYESQFNIAKDLWIKWQANLMAELSEKDEAAEITNLRQSILESETAIVKGKKYTPGKTYTGRAYYVSNNGNDANNGRSPKKAWATLDRVSREGLSRGDAIFLERGGTYRGYLNLFNPDGGVTLSAYGEGAKPVVTTAPENAASADKWELYQEGGDGARIWKYHEYVTDCGTVVFDDHLAGRKITAVWTGTEWACEDGTAFDVSASLTANLDFFCDDAGKFGGATDISQTNDGTASDVQLGPLYLRCDEGNPGTLFQSIELCALLVSRERDGGGYNESVIGMVDDVTIDNICIKYYGMFGINYGSGCVIQNCEFAWGGGCTQIVRNGKATGRAGDALCGGGAENLQVVHCYFHDLFSQALIFEAHGMKTKNALFSGNLLERTAGINVDYDDGEISGLVIQDNIFRQSGLSWADQQLLHTEIWAGGEFCKDIRIRLQNTRIEARIANNSFYDPFQFSLYFGSDETGNIPEIDGNVYHFADNSYALAWWQRSEINRLYHTILKEQAESFLRDVLHDDTSEVSIGES